MSQNILCTDEVAKIITPKNIVDLLSYKWLELQLGVGHASRMQSPVGCCHEIRHIDGNIIIGKIFEAYSDTWGAIIPISSAKEILFRCETRVIYNIRAIIIPRSFLRPSGDIIIIQRDKILATLQ